MYWWRCELRSKPFFGNSFFDCCRAKVKICSGILLVDKPAGINSRIVGRKIARHLGHKKFGHVGTLDPGATGLLIILLGQATKLSNYLTLERKRYAATVRLGASTDTYDLDGTIVCEDRTTQPGQNQVEKALEGFRGEFMQVPPPVSAIKVNGVPSYKKVRSGESVALDPRQVRIDELILHDYNYPDIELEVLSSKGTYIRSLAHDLGHKLNTYAALGQLRRLESEPFHLMHATALETLLAMEPEETNRYIIPLENALVHWRKYVVDSALDARLHVGNLPQGEDLKGLIEFGFEAGEQLILAGTQQIALVEMQTSATRAMSHPKPYKYLRVIARDE